MNRVIVRASALLAIVAVAACSSGPLSSTLPSQQSAMQSSAVVTSDELVGPASGDIPFRGSDPVRQLCPAPVGTDTMQCFAMVRTDVVPQLTSLAEVTSDATEIDHPAAEKCPFQPGSGYCPNELQAAYNLPSLKNGNHRVVAIVDAYGYQKAASDLAVFRNTMGLPACGTASGCLRIVNQNGGTGLPAEPPPSDDWKGEQSLDLDMVSAICPNCRILLVQTNDALTNDLYAGVDEAAKLGAKYVSLSWGSGERGSASSTFQHSGVVIVAAAGDNGGGGPNGGPQQPCSYASVVCVGGTHLAHAGNKRGWTETVWNDWTYDRCGNGTQPCGATGSGCSADVPKPAWQNDHGCTKRSEADVAADASLRTPVITYNSEESGCSPSSCYWAYGGTSASTPMIAATFALAGNASVQTGAKSIWKHKGGTMNDVTKGNNVDPNIGVSCDSSVGYICTARPGYDGPTGWGSPNGIGAF